MSDNDIVITGMSGRFPESRNVEEFGQNLYSGIDMVTQTEDRWPEGTYGIANRMGRIPDYKKFDGSYFGIGSTNAENIDPPGRLILEATHEAIVDAGVNPQSIRGSQTGVYVGFSHYPNTEGLAEDVQPDLDYQKSRLTMRTIGNMKSILANRVSFVFDFKGPSLTTDTACSASFSALALALNDLKLGHVENAIVGGSHMTMEPFLVQMLAESGVCSPRGMSAVLDGSADGFVKADAVVVVFLQRRKNARRIYCTLRSARLNVDGHKKVGQFFPSSEAQEALMIESIRDAKVNPLDLSHFEGHFTGTRAGDPEEIKAIYNAYCGLPGRKDILTLGCLKGNIGHTEGASGLASLVKVMIAFENECLPPNINIKEIKHKLKEYCPPLYPNQTKVPYKPGLAAINNFGAGGANAHVIVEPNYKLTYEDNLKIAEEIPRIANICGRTEESVKHIFNFIENNPDKVTRDFLALLGETMKQVPSINSQGFPFRGSIIIEKCGENETGIQYKYKKQISELKSKTRRPIWLLFPGLGGQWSGMAKALMPIAIFRNTIDECHRTLEEFGFDLKHILLSEDKNAIASVTAKYCATIATEIALFEVLKALHISPDGIIGHSFGEIAAAYADGCLTASQTMITAYLRASITEKDKTIPKSIMAVCGISKYEAKKFVTNEVVIACNNAKNTVVLSGPEKQMTEIMDKLKADNVFVFQLDSSGLPFHHSCLKSCSESMIAAIKQHIPEPALRSNKWVSTSILDDNLKNDVLNYASAEYFVNNLVSPVYFFDKLKDLPSDAIVVEVGPHGLFRKIVSETLESASYVSLLKKDSNDTNLDIFLNAITKFYELGVNPAIESLYPKVEFPVSRRTASVGSLVKWDHSAKYNDKQYPDHFNRSTAGDMNVVVDMKLTQDSFFMGHCIDGNILYPATGYLMLAWRIFAASMGRTWIDVPVVFESVQFKRPIFLTEADLSKVKVVYSRRSYDFHILENDNLCCEGKVRAPVDDPLLLQSLLYNNQNKEGDTYEEELVITRDDIYKDFRVRGYDYSGEFRKLLEVRTRDFKTMRGTCEWNGNMVPFLDCLLQAQMMARPMRNLMVPTMVNCLRIDPKVMFDAIRANKQDEESTLDVISGDDIDAMSDLKDENHEAKNFLSTGVKRFCKFKSTLNFSFNYKTRILVAPGIEIESLQAYQISRKMPNTLNLDSYEFVANQDHNAICDYDSNYINEYLQVCKSLLHKVKDLYSIEVHCDMSSDKITPEVIERHRHENSDRKVMLKILDKLLKTVDENKNIDKNIQTILQDVNLDLTRDIVNEVSKNDRMIRTLVDIVTENNATKKLYKVNEINLTGDVLAKEVKSYIEYSQLKPTEVDYKMFVKSVNNVRSDMRDKASEWTAAEVPQLSDSDLVILRDSKEMWHLDGLVDTVCSAVADNCFLMFVAKYRWTEPEEALKPVTNGTTFTRNIELEERIKKVNHNIINKGFNLICLKSDSISTKAFMFRKVTQKKEIPKDDQIIEVTAERDEKWFDAIRENILKNKDAIDAGEQSPNVWLISRDSDINGIIALIKCLRLEPGGENFRCIHDMDAKLKLPIDWTSQPFADILANDLVANVLKDGQLGTYRHMKLPKDYDKTISTEYFLNNGNSKDLSSLSWYDARGIVANDVAYDWINRLMTLVRVQIYTTGLIFKDVMLVTGRIPAGQVSLISDCIIGLEFAGRRPDTGERVMGFADIRGFATFNNAREEFVSPIPDHWTMNDSVTILSTYFTLWYGLVKRGGLNRGDSVLIHSGAGGVGQSAINMCKHFGCDIYVTVGNEEKKKFIVDEFGLAEDHIFSSRNIQFKYKILEMTDGRGVDVVINSLIGEKLDASYEVLSLGGRFVEIGKYDMYQNKQIGMYNFLKDSSFIAVASDIGFMREPQLVAEFFVWMHQNCHNGCVKPYKQIVFEAKDADKAFRYMTTGKHIGKIIIKIMDEEENRGPIEKIPTAPAMPVVRKTYFNPNKAYVIIGGLGGLGLELIHWMCFMGARKILVTSRNGITTNYQRFALERIRAFGHEMKIMATKIAVSKNDCMTVERAQRVLRDAEELGPIGGIFHLGIVLNDCLLEKHTFDKFCESIDCKYRVFDCLDKTTRQLQYALDYFVVFSSVICGKGNTGQTNYGFGNSLCERICEQRRRDGLHGLAIQFGPIADVGVFMSSTQVVEMSTLQKQRINSCIEVLDKLLAVDYPIVTSWVLAEMTAQSGNRQKRMIGELWKALGVDPENTPGHLTLGEIGLESMLAVELQQELEREFNIKMNINHIKTITVAFLKDYECGKVSVIKHYIDEMKRSRDILSRYNFTMPTETHTRLNDVKTGKPIYFMPPMEITFSAYEEFAQKFDRPVIGLNWTRDMNGLETMKDINQYFSDLLKKLEPKGGYDLVGYLDGAIVVSKQLLKGKVSKAVIIDILKDERLITQDQVNEELILEFFFQFMANDLPETFSDKIKRGVLAESDTSNRIKRLVDEFKDFAGRGLIAPDMEEIFATAIKRATILVQYRAHKKSKFANKLKERVGKKWAKKSGKLHVIKAFRFDKVDDVEHCANLARESYLLPDQSEDSNQVLSVEAVDHYNSFAVTSEQIGDKIIEVFKR